MAGNVRLLCRDDSCGEVVLLAHRKGMLRPVGASVIIGVNFGSAYVECGTCHGTSIWNGQWDGRRDPSRRAAPVTDRQLDVLAYPPPATIVQVMEERWEQFRREKLRERGRVASGLRFDVFTRDKFRCRYCGRSIDDGIILHADHVIPESKGGPTTLENLVTACSDCNLGKSDKDLPSQVQTG